MKKTIYISGKITGDPGYFGKFHEEELRLARLGYFTANPTKIVHSQKIEWSTAMKIVLREMLLCDGVSLLPDWSESKGAQIEKWLAAGLGMDVRDSEYWT
jgi:hypothetical protein